MADDAPPPEPDKALVAAMADRVVARKKQDYGRRKPGPGRPKGHPKTGGRKAGTPSLWTPEFREYLAKKARPFELLADICSGRQIDDGGVKRKPNLAERMRAAETLGRKLLPDLAASQVSAVVSDQREGLYKTSVLPPEIERARAVAFLLAQAVDKDPTLGMPLVDPLPPQDAVATPEKETPETEVVRDDGDALKPSPTEPAPQNAKTNAPSVRFAGFQDDEARWEVRGTENQLLATAISQQDAVSKARQLGDQA
ncbi:MAG: hypothetical protein AAF683_04100 [Pseudomonadota bacterium]